MLSFFASLLLDFLRINGVGSCKQSSQLELAGNFLSDMRLGGLFYQRLSRNTQFLMWLLDHPISVNARLRFKPS